MLAAQVISAHVAAHGWVCPGWRRPAHPVPVGGLQGDHIIPKSIRPDLCWVIENIAPLCGRCNLQKRSSMPTREEMPAALVAFLDAERERGA